MRISQIQHYNQPFSYNKQNINGCSFKGFEVKADLKSLFKTPELARPFAEEVSKWSSEPLNLMELIDVRRLNDTGKKVLKEFFKLINNEKMIQDYPVEMWITAPERICQHAYPRYYATLPVCDENGEIKLKEGHYIDVRNYGNLKYLMGIGHGEAVQMESLGFTKRQLRYSLTDHIKEVANKVAEFEAKRRKEKSFEDLQNSIESSNKRTAIEKAVTISDEDMLPVSSVVCTIDDVGNYLMEHLAEINEGRIFNKPVTKDGESLLIGLVHTQPDKENINKYVSLIKNMGKMPFINYNQKDAMDIPAVAHVLNSQNKVLFAAFCNCKDLKYEPSLEFEFNSITDPKFKDLVLNSHIFENEQNTEFKTIFGQPNPVYKK